MFDIQLYEKNEGVDGADGADRDAGLIAVMIDAIAPMIRLTDHGMMFGEMFIDEVILGGMAIVMLAITASPGFSLGWPGLTGALTSLGIFIAAPVAVI